MQDTDARRNVNNGSTPFIIPPSGQENRADGIFFGNRAGAMLTPAWGKGHGVAWREKSFGRRLTFGGTGGDQFRVIDAEAGEMVQERQEKPSDLGIGDAKTSSMLALHGAGGEHAALRVQNRRGG